MLTSCPPPKPISPSEHRALLKLCDRLQAVQRSLVSIESCYPGLYHDPALLLPELETVGIDVQAAITVSAVLERLQRKPDA